MTNTADIPTSAEYEPITKAGISMAWHHLMFAHWRWPAEEIQQRLPPGLTVECFDSSAWLGVVPFWMQSVRMAVFPRLLLAKSFLELNLRTYVRYQDGRTGVWFFTLDCNHLPSVMGARIGFSLPYRRARIHSELSSDQQTVSYRSERAGLASEFSYAAASSWRAASADPLENFLCERYRLFSWRAMLGRMLVGQVSHSPYQVADAQATIRCDNFFRLNNFEPPSRPADHCLVAEPVEVLSSRPAKA